jgi:trans-aconitate 2-methyltransferase
MISASNRYTFGTNSLAAQRLELLASAFEGPTRRLLTTTHTGRPPPQLALDLGAGLGHSTRLLASIATGCRCVGLERSPQFVAQARAALEAEPYLNVEILEHDVLVEPFPVSGADWILVRFLLTHISNPVGALELWARALTTTGSLILQETAEMASTDPILTRYYECVAALQQHYGQRLDIGTRFVEMTSAAGLKGTHTASRIEQDAAVMARLHALNIATWRQDPFAREHLGQAELDVLERGLNAIASGQRHAAPVRVVLAEFVGSAA